MNRDAEKVKILKAELAARSQRNPRYSIRAFAQFLGVSHTTLSEVLAGKRPLSQRAGVRIVERLKPDPEAARIFLGPYAGQRTTKSKPAKIETAQLDLDTFALISDWLHYALLSLLEIEALPIDGKIAAKRLGAGIAHTRICLERLENLELIRRDGHHYVATGKLIRIGNRQSSAAARKFQQQLMEKAIESLHADPFEVRDMSSMTMAIDPALIPYAREKIMNFRRQLVSDLEARGQPKEVYNLTVQIYPVSKKVTANEA